MAPPIVYDTAAEGASLKGQLFAGKTFFVIQRCPFRDHILGLIQSNGGTVVKLEKQATYLIADHTRRRFSPPGSTSFKFVEDSVEQGALLDPTNYSAGPAQDTPRETGSMSRPPRGGRAKYTFEEDQLVYNWVRDHEATGGRSSGNKLYQELEQKYPQHTWQSWRDRYLKHLVDRPPSTFKLPEDAPSLSQRSIRPLGSSTSRPQETSSAQSRNSSDAGKLSGKGKTKTKSPQRPERFTVDDFDSLFSTEVWEDLYVTAEHITSVSTEEYIEGWEDLAKSKMKKGYTQTAEQWRQYFERVVRPQWKRDPASKKEEIQRRVHERYDSSQKEGEESGLDEAEETEESGSETEDEEATTYEEVPGADETCVAQSERKSLPANSKEEYKQKQASGSRQSAKATEGSEKETQKPHPKPDDREENSAQANNPQEPAHAIIEPSSSTARHQTPTYISELKEVALKRYRDGDVADEENRESAVSTPRNKKQKLARPSPKPGRSLAWEEARGTQEVPLVLSSGVSSSYDSPNEQDAVGPPQRVDEGIDETEDEDEDANKADDAVTSHLPKLPPATEDHEESDGLEFMELPKLPSLQDEESDGSVIGEMPKLPPAPENDEADGNASNASTPRAPRQNNGFDTQAILSSPTQGFSLGKLPRLDEFTQVEKTSQNSSPGFEILSPAGHPASEASTTHSLKEFRRSLDDCHEEEPLYPALPLPKSPTTASEASRSEAGDPDPPLRAGETKDFIEGRKADGFNHAQIIAALRCTCARPSLACEVLDAWSEGKPLPDKRGIWSKEEDEAAHSGDGVAIGQLQKKHTMDEWGGVWERMGFLEKARNRGS